MSIPSPYPSFALVRSKVYCPPLSMMRKSLLSLCSGARVLPRMSSTTVEWILSIVMVSPFTGSFSCPFLMSFIRASAPAEFLSFASVATKMMFLP